MSIRNGGQDCKIFNGPQFPQKHLFVQKKGWDSWHNGIFEIKGHINLASVMIFGNHASGYKDLRANFFEEGSLMRSKIPNHLPKLIGLLFTC